MKQKDIPYSVTSFPSNRISTFDIGFLSKAKHSIPALLEIDVTNLRNKIKTRKQQGITTSFTAELLILIAQSLQIHPQVTGTLLNKRHIALFNSIDIAIVVERQVEGTEIPMPYVIRNVDKKSGSEIVQEITAAKTTPLKHDEIVLQKRTKLFEKLYFKLPGFLRRAIWRFVFRKPETAFKTMGNAVFTSVASTANINGWFINTSIHPVSFGIAGIVKKPRVISDTIEIRDIMNMTVVMDHNIVDGVPMAKFIKTLVRKIESQSHII